MNQGNRSTRSETLAHSPRARSSAPRRSTPLRALGAGVVAAGLLALAIMSPHTDDGGTVPTDRHGGDPSAASGPTHLFGVSLASVSALADATALAHRLDRHLDVIDLYSDWTSGFPTPEVTAIAATGAEPEITWEPWDYARGPVQDIFSLTSITSGSFDTYIQQWAAAAAVWKRPLYLRFAHEMNGDWYPWAIGVNGNTASEYIAAYRHVHALFQAAGATNVSWIWSPNVIWRAGSDPSPMYPGSDDVDVIGIDGYNPGQPGGPWSSPRQVFGATLARVATFAPDKRIIITETGSSEVGGNKAAWVTDFLRYIAAAPSVVGFVWSEYAG
ncbi:MAG TPA: glycosyl hydrolase, partial [Acidimicrobiales bacterium]|nr:glycosyl hydrolase [Acidimicrobiales bacterium]